MTEDNHNDSAKRRTKIVATLGPATDGAGVLEKIISLGVNVVRLNFSHGTHDDHIRRIKNVREEAKKQKRVVGVLADLQGPKIRIANFVEGKIHLNVGDAFILDADFDDNLGNRERIGIDYKELPQDVNVDDILLLDDGRLSFKVKKILGSEIHCTVLVGGELSNHKGINRQGGGLSARALTDKDIKDLHCAVAQTVDYIAISFPRDAADINQARDLIKESEGSAGIIAKIERVEAVENLEEIISASDGIMVARGDLAVEIGNAEVPLVQKEIIHATRSMNKPVIIATQMMESMIESSVPTRAEVSDVANAVLENVDAVMLSAETASGLHPALVVEQMHHVCVRVEQQPNYQKSSHRVERRFERCDEAVAMATMYTANHLDIRAIVCLTESGATPLCMSRIRTGIPIYGLSRFGRALGRMSLYRGVYPFEFDVTQCTRDEVNSKSVEAMHEQELLSDGDMVILTKGDHMGIGGGSNAMKILRVGKIV